MKPVKNKIWDEIEKESWREIDSEIKRNVYMEAGLEIKYEIMSDVYNTSTNNKGV